MSISLIWVLHTFFYTWIKSYEQKNILWNLTGTAVGMPSGISFCDVIAPDARSQDQGLWGKNILYTARVFLDPPRVVLFEILPTPMIRMVRTSVIEYRLSFPAGGATTGLTSELGSRVTVLQFVSRRWRHHSIKNQCSSQHWWVWASKNIGMRCKTRLLNSGLVWQLVYWNYRVLTYRSVLGRSATTC